MVIFELFTDAAAAVFRHGVDEALRLNAKEVEPVHLLLGIMDADGGIAATVLQGKGVGRQSVVREQGLVEGAATGPQRFHNRDKGGAIQYSGASAQALKAAKQLQSPTFSAEHLLLGLLETKEVKALLDALGAGADSIGSTVKDRLRGAG